MNLSVNILAPVVGGAVLIITYLAFRLHGEAMKYVAEVKFFLEQKTLAYNRTNASLSVIQSKMAETQKRSYQLERENTRLRKSLEIMNQFVEEKSLHNKVDTYDSEKVDYLKIQNEIKSISNILNRDLKVQLKNYSREVSWLTKRLDEVQQQLGQNSEDDKTSSLADLSYDNVA